MIGVYLWGGVDRVGIEHIDKCICGHDTNRHKDLGLFDGWGLGECELCACHKFECPACVENMEGYEHA